MSAYIFPTENKTLTEVLGGLGRLFGPFMSISQAVVVETDDARLKLILQNLGDQYRDLHTNQDSDEATRDFLGETDSFVQAAAKA